LAAQPRFLALIDRDPDAFWRAFVEGHSGTLLAVLRRYLPDDDLRMDAYLFLLEGLRAEGFRSFRTYVARSRAREIPFEAWLKIVARNLTLDFLRHHKGRRTEPKVVEAMDPASRLLFRSLYWDRMTHAEALETLRARIDPAMRVSDVAARADAIEAALAAAGHPLARGESRRNRRFYSFDDPDARTALERDATAAAAGAGLSPPEPADVAVERRERTRWLLQAIRDLSSEDRLLLRLRYEEGLTAAAIAPVVGAPSAKAVYKRLDRLIDTLRARGWAWFEEQPAETSREGERARPGPLWIGRGNVVMPAGEE